MADRKRAIILGGSSGIGKATAQRFAREGWQVLIASSDGEKAEAAKNTLQGREHLAFPLDIRDAERLQVFADQVRSEWGSFDVLVNSIGVSRSLDVLHADFTEWNNALQVMLYGNVKSARALVPLMADGGRIINVTSIHGDRVEKGSSGYGMSKAAITQFTRSLALELAPRGILANTIAPGFVRTPMSVDEHGRNELETEWFYDNYIKYHHLPLKRPGQPEEVAGVVYFLAGPDASYITGSVVTVDGGLTITF